MSVWRKMVLTALAMVGGALLFMVVGVGSEGLGLVFVSMALSMGAALLMVVAAVGFIVSLARRTGRG